MLSTLREATRLNRSFFSSELSICIRFLLLYSCKYRIIYYILSYIVWFFFRALKKNSSFGFFTLGFACRQKNPMCCLCGWLFSLQRTVLAMVSLRKNPQDSFRRNPKIANTQEFPAENSAAMNY